MEDWKKNSPNNTMMSFGRIFGGTSVIPMSGIMRFKSWIKDIHLCNKWKDIRRDIEEKNSYYIYF